MPLTIAHPVAVLPLFKVLQHGSTVLGVAVLIVMAARHRGWQKPVSFAACGIVSLVGCTSVAGGLVFGVTRSGHVASLQALQRLVGISVVAGLALAVTEITVRNLIWHIRRRKSAPTDGGAASQRV